MTEMFRFHLVVSGGRVVRKELAVCQGLHQDVEGDSRGMCPGSWSVFLASLDKRAQGDDLSSGVSFLWS